MLPSILAGQLQKGIGDYIETTFPITNEPFKVSVRKMLAKKASLYHEPYVAVRLPFRVAEFGAAIHGRSLCQGWSCQCKEYHSKRQAQLLCECAFVAGTEAVKICCPFLDALVSGSPIIQNGKFIGAVTHVLVQDSRKGYGIFENMLEH